MGAAGVQKEHLLASSSFIPSGKRLNLKLRFQGFARFLLFAFLVLLRAMVCLFLPASFPTSIWFWQPPRGCEGLLWHGQLNQEILAAFGACARCIAAFPRKHEGNKSRWLTFATLAAWWGQPWEVGQKDHNLLLDHWNLFGFWPWLTFLGRILGLIILRTWIPFQVCVRQAVFCLWEGTTPQEVNRLSPFCRQGNPLVFYLNYVCLFKFLLVNIIPQGKGLFPLC